jgi:hypothetical protein
VRGNGRFRFPNPATRYSYELPAGGGKLFPSASQAIVIVLASTPRFNNVSVPQISEMVANPGLTL